MPDVPSTDEAGLPGTSVLLGWHVAPAKTPQAVIERVAREIKAASTDPKFVAALPPPRHAICCLFAGRDGARGRERTQ